MSETILEKAERIATEAHEGQVDKAGKLYIAHVRRVVNGVPDVTAKVVAWLHDVVEDNPAWSIERLRREGFPDEVVEAVRLLTKVAGVDVDEYFSKIEAHPLARRVKLSDLRDNADLSRIDEPTDKDRERCRRYLRRIAQLQHRTMSEVG